MPARCAPRSRKCAHYSAGSTTSIIGGQRIRTNDKIKSINPAKPSQVVGLHQKAGKEHVEPAMQAALESLCQLEPDFV